MTEILLPDGREIVSTRTACHLVGVTAAYFPTLARRNALTRFATKNAKGAPAHYWLLSQVKSLRAKRAGANVVAQVAPGQFIEDPFEKETES